MGESIVRGLAVAFGVKVKLGWRKTRTYKGEDYGKWVVHPPVELVQALGWEAGDELTVEIRDDGLLFRKVQ